MIQALEGEMFITNLHTRFPFRYGIAELRAMPHLFLQLSVESNGRQVSGLAADSLPPRWFTKDPDADYKDEIRDMLSVIRAAVKNAIETGPATSVFDLWWETYQAQRDWALDTPHPPLLWNFGVSLVERALIDAFCRQEEVSFPEALRTGRLGFDPGRIHAPLIGRRSALLLPKKPAESVLVRHTIGLADPLYSREIPGNERLTDGLPQSLDENIRVYGLQSFKIKIMGEPEEDLRRLSRIAEILERTSGKAFSFTLDGNEQYHDAAHFREFWERLKADKRLSGFLKHLILVEQPLHRDDALSPETAEILRDWEGRPAMIIDESDAEPGSLPAALEIGYDGTSHKNCKGVFKGLANACLLASMKQDHPEMPFIMTGEDLTNIGPVALLQDLTVMAVLGMEHVERNGHHYFAGLSMMPQDWQQETLATHPDLYFKTEAGFPAVQIINGRIRFKSAFAAPFGWGGQLAFDGIQSAAQWQAGSLFTLQEQDGPLREYNENIRETG